jgi:hypothetical protein
MRSVASSNRHAKTTSPLLGMFDGGSSEQRRRLFYAGNGRAGRDLFRSGGRSRLLEAVGAAKFLAETFYSAGGVDELLLAREERVAVAANVDAQLGLGATRDERVAAGAVNGTGLITGMNLRLHVNSLGPIVRHAETTAF